MTVFRPAQVDIRSIQAMQSRSELDLTPEFQRRNVWSEMARSYLIDTILRGKPIPAIYLRTVKNARTGAVRQEVVDGQQRLITVLSYLEDGFPVKKIHNDDFPDLKFSELPPTAGEEFLTYQFACNFLLDAPDSEVWDIFARLNRYPVKINYQELRNSQYFGAFKSTAYQLANEFNAFFTQAGIFTIKQVSRMAEVEFVSELLIAVSSGIKGKSKATIDKAYMDWDDDFPNRTTIIGRFRRTMDLIGAILQFSSPESALRRDPILYSLFCAVYHMQFRLPGLTDTRRPLRLTDIPKARIALEKIDTIFEIDASDLSSLSSDERAFRLATDVHTIHGGNRLTRVHYIIKLLNRALKSRR